MKSIRKAILAALFLATSCGTQAVEISVFAAASLTESLKEIATNYEKQSGDKIIFNLGASSILARQIEEGAPADIFFSADEAKMDGLQRKGLIEVGTRKRRLGNALVVVVALDCVLRIDSAGALTNAGVRKLALAEPKTVPAGIYAKQWLDKTEVWTAVEPRIIPTENVRAALAAVESGNVEAGIVYKTDVGISRKVKVAYEVPAKESPEISYPVALVKDSKHPEAARRFLQYLNSADATRVFVKLGFIIRE